MLTIGKIFQAVGIAIIGIGFIANFPQLINGNSLIFGIIFFGLGWIIEKRSSGNS